MINHRHQVTFGLLFGAIVWGLIWYPYRQLELAGISGIQSTFITYSIALTFGLIIYGRHWRALTNIPKQALWIGIAAGWANLSYVLAILQGEVMRVLLLFYLAPLWTLFLARWLLAERINLRGLLIMALSLSGMFTMLWQAGGWPLPQTIAEWLALSSGLAFASANVFTRLASDMTLRAKSLSVWSGVSLIALVFLLNEPTPSSILTEITITDWLLMLVIGILLAVTTWLVQFGVTHTPANRAAVIFMFELVVAAVSSYWLAAEIMTLREWIGGAMIIAASLMTSK